MASDRALSLAPFGATVVGIGAGNGPHGWGSTMIGGRGDNTRGLLLWGGTLP